MEGERNETKETPPRTNICYSNTDTNSCTANVRSCRAASMFEIVEKRRDLRGLLFLELNLDDSRVSTSKRIDRTQRRNHPISLLFLFY